MGIYLRMFFISLAFLAAGFIIFMFFGHINKEPWGEIILIFILTTALIPSAYLPWLIMEWFINFFKLRKK